MADVSNKLLAVLVIIAMIISVFGTITAFLKLGELSPLVTGAGTTGMVNLSVESLVSVNFSFQGDGGTQGPPGNISWGSGAVTAGASFANLTTRGTTTNWNGSAVTGALHLENTGNRGCKLILSSTNASAATFLGGTNPIYRLNMSEDGENSCFTTATESYNIQSTGLNGSFFSNATFNVNATRTICGNFSFQSGNDELLIGFYLGLPSDSTAGVHQDIIGATITAA